MPFWDQIPGGTGSGDGSPGAPGSDGDNGWSPIIAVVPDGDRRVLQVSSWVGGQGDAPATGQYVGATGLVDTPAEAVDIRGSQGHRGETGSAGQDGQDGDPGRDGRDGNDGDPGDPGSDGDDGWSPELAIVEDRDRRVLQVIGWVGGTGLTPATGQYVGGTGLVAGISDAVDIRGAKGDMGDVGQDGSDGAPGQDGRDGIDGQDGAPGPPGPAGAQGPAGADAPVGVLAGSKTITAAYSLLPEDRGYLLMGGSTDTVITVPTGTFEDDSFVLFLRSTAALTFEAGAGVTVNVPESRTAGLRAQGSMGGLIRQGSADTWHAFGDLAEVS